MTSRVYLRWLGITAYLTRFGVALFYFIFLLPDTFFLLCLFTLKVLLSNVSCLVPLLVHSSISTTCFFAWFPSSCWNLWIYTTSILFCIHVCTISREIWFTLYVDCWRICSFLIKNFPSRLQTLAIKLFYFISLALFKRAQFSFVSCSFIKIVTTGLKFTSVPSNLHCFDLIIKLAFPLMISS